MKVRVITSFAFLTLCLWTAAVHAKPKVPERRPAYAQKTELFSWQENNEWYYTVLNAESAPKTKTQIVSTKVKGFDKMIILLKTVTPRSEVVWNGYPVSGIKLVKPPQDVRDRVMAFCKRHELNCK
jgi:hypothetical protein